MMPAPMELPRVTATPKVTPSTRSKFPVLGLGLALTLVESIWFFEAADSGAQYHAGATVAGRIAENRVREISSPATPGCVGCCDARTKISWREFSPRSPAELPIRRRLSFASAHRCTPTQPR